MSRVHFVDGEMERRMFEQKQKNRVLAFLCLVFFFDAMALGVILPILPDLIEELSGLPASNAAEVGGYLLFAFAIMQFICAPIIGGLSDRFGRRRVLLLALLGFSLDYFVMAMAPTLLWLFVARLLSGMFGAVYASGNACVVDISSTEDRARNFGLTGAAVGLGFILGPVMGGLLGQIDTRLPFWVSGILTGLICLYGLFALPETLKVENRRKFEWKRANPFGTLFSVSRYPFVLGILGALFLMQVSNQSYVSVWAFFTREVAGWTPFYVGISAAFYGLIMAGVQGGLVGPTVKKFGEVRPILWSFGVGALAYMILAFAQSGSMIYLGILVGSLSGLAFPAMQALMTKGIPEDSQGELQGAIASLHSLSSIVGPLMMTRAFGIYTREPGLYFPGAPFLLGALLIAMATALFVTVLRFVDRS